MAEPEPIRVFLVDDQAMVRAGFRMLVDSQPDLRVVGEAGDGLAALERLRRHPGRRGADGRPDAATRRRGDDPPPRRPARRPAGDRADHVRPRRVRLRRAQGRGRGLPAQGRRPTGPARRDPGGARRRLGRRAEHHRAGCCSSSPRPCPTRPPTPVRPTPGSPPSPTASGRCCDWSAGRRSNAEIAADLVVAEAHGQDPHRPAAGQDRLPRPGTAGRARVRDRPGRASLTPTSRENAPDRTEMGRNGGVLPQSGAYSRAPPPQVVRRRRIGPGGVRPDPPPAGRPQG